MPRQRDPKRDEAKSIWLKNRGNIKLVDLAKQMDVTPSTIRKWKTQDYWDNELKGSALIPKKSAPNKNIQRKDSNQIKKGTEDSVVESGDLTEKQRLFCLYYVKTFNATQSAIKAGYSADTAHVQGPRLLGNVRVASEIKRIKSNMTHDLFLDAMDVLQKWIRIAFADITDYLSFGQKEVPVIGSFGPVKDEDGNQVTQIVNYVDFKESNVIDGTIISEVKQGKDGVSIKLEDRMKALEKLSLYFDLFPDNFKRKIETERLELEKQKISGEGDKDDNLIDDWVNAVMTDE